MADTEFGKALLEGLREAAAWKRGAQALETVHIDPMPPLRIKAIRKRVARSAAAFEKRFGIPSATVSNWEQGRRKPDPAAVLLLKMIERDAAAVEAAARSE
jgi:putative transcriptional regulator